MISLSDLRPLDPTDYELSTLSRWLAGTYTFEQPEQNLSASGQEASLQPRMRIMPVTIDRLTGYGQVLYVSVQTGDAPPEPVVEKVYLVARTQAGQLVSRIFDLQFADSEGEEGSLFRRELAETDVLRYLTTQCLSPSTDPDIIWKAWSVQEKSSSSTGMLFVPLLLMFLLGIGLRFGLTAASIVAVAMYSLASKLLLARYMSSDMRFSFVSANAEGYVEDSVFAILRSNDGAGPYLLKKL